MLLRFASFLCVPLALAAQPNSELFTKAPPVVEEALRTRVTAFYEAQMAGKFRQADQYVAEEAKDAFYGAEKPNCKAWKLEKILWEEGYTKARAFSTCDTTLMNITGPMNVKMPLISHWKLVDGQWFWYLPPSPPVRITPFGEMRAGPPAKDATPPPVRMPTPEEIVSQLKLSKNSVTLSLARESADEVVFTNSTPGNVHLSLDYRSWPGFSAVLDKGELKAGESAKILLKYTPSAQKPAGNIKVSLRVDPFTLAMPIEVSFR